MKTGAQRVEVIILTSIALKITGVSGLFIAPPVRQRVSLSGAAGYIIAGLFVFHYVVGWGDVLRNRLPVLCWVRPPYMSPFLLVLPSVIYWFMWTAVSEITAIGPRPCSYLMMAQWIPGR